MPNTAALKYKRVLLKISGEALMGDQGYGIDVKACLKFAEEVKSAIALGVQMCLVIGGGNIWRGATGAAAGMERAQADQMGMLATIMNALAMQNALENIGIPTRVQSAVPMQSICEPFIRRRAIRHMEKGRVVIFAAGTGNPFFTTDTAAALRAIEVHAEAILMAKNGVEGVYTSDPNTDPGAEFIPEITHMDAVSRGLRVMDATALTLCAENKLPIYVFNMDDERNIDRIVSGERVGTLVKT
jgi:uridylate kinase